MHQSWLGICAPTDTFVVGIAKARHADAARPILVLHDARRRLLPPSRVQHHQLGAAVYERNGGRHDAPPVVRVRPVRQHDVVSNAVAVEGQPAVGGHGVLQLFVGDGTHPPRTSEV